MRSRLLGAWAELPVLAGYEPTLPTATAAGCKEQRRTAGDDSYAPCSAAAAGRPSCRYPIFSPATTRRVALVYHSAEKATGATISLIDGTEQRGCCALRACIFVGFAMTACWTFRAQILESRPSCGWLLAGIPMTARARQDSRLEQSQKLQPCLDALLLP